MKRVLFIVFGFLGIIINQAPAQETVYDVEYVRVCLIDSIAPDTLVQFWRFSQANNPGGNVVDVTYDLSGAYTHAGTLLPCCSCLTAASDNYAIAPAMPRPPSPGLGWWWVPIGLVLAACTWGLFLLALLWKPKRLRIAYFLPLALLFSYSSLSAQSETRYDIEYTCICLVDSIGPGNVVQFYRFTQANNPGGNVVDVTYDLSGAYTPAGTVMGCNDYYLGDNVNTGGGTAGTLAIWTGTYSLGNSSVTESGGNILSTSFTGAFGLATGTTAQAPVGANGLMRYNTTGNGISAWNGAAAAWQYLPWAVSPTNTNNTILLGGGSTGMKESTWTISGSTMTAGGTGILALNNAAGKITFGSAAPGSYIVGSNVAPYRGLRINSGLNTHTPAVFLTTDENIHFVAGYMRGGSYGTTTAASFSGGGFFNLIGLQQSGVTVSGYRGSDGTGHNRNGGTLTVRGGISNDSNASAGNLVLEGGRKGDAWAAFSGTVGDIILGTYPNHSVEADHLSDNVRRNVLVIKGNTYNVEFYQRKQTTTGIQTLTMEADTVKYRIENIGAISTSTDGSGDIVVAHGMGVTPTVVDIQFTGTSGSATPYVYVVLTDGTDATNFTIRVFDMTGAAVTSTAVTATWHAKT